MNGYHASKDNEKLRQRIAELEAMCKTLLQSEYQTAMREKKLRETRVPDGLLERTITGLKLTDNYGRGWGGDDDKLQAILDKRRSHDLEQDKED